MQQEARHRWGSSLNRTTTSGSNTVTIVETVDSYPNTSFLLPMNTMTNGRDRTSEFQTTVKSFASRRVR